MGGVAAALAVGAVTAAAPAQAGIAAPQPRGAVNDNSCKPSAAHPDPVVMLHGLGADKYLDINAIQADLALKGYCTFSLTYGAYPAFPIVGGLTRISESAPQIRDFVLDVLAKTGAAKVDLVGHSEGAFQALYVPKMMGIADKINRTVAIAPPTHGTTASGFLTLAEKLVGRNVLNFFGSAGLPVGIDLLTNGPAVNELNNGPVTVPGVNYTVIASTHDEGVTPTANSFVHEPGVTNEYIQDSCRFDPVGHIGEPYDPNVWQLVSNALDPGHARPIVFCAAGLPL